MGVIGMNMYQKRRMSSFLSCTSKSDKFACRLILVDASCIEGLDSNMHSGLETNLTCADV